MRICLVEECNENSPYKDGYCSKHHYQYKKHGKIIDEEIQSRKNVICKVEGCDNKAGWRSKICSKHYMQLYQNGKILERTKYDPNKIIIHKDYAEIEIYNMKNELVAYSQIDFEDVEKVKKYKWCLSHGYAITFNGKKHINLSDLLMNFKGTRNIVVDHIDRNKLNNRKINLRIVKHKVNAWNRDKSALNTSGYIGVTFDKNPRHNYWIASINNTTIGCFKDKEDAIEARLKAEKEYEKKLYGDDTTCVPYSST